MREKCRDCRIMLVLKEVKERIGKILEEKEVRGEPLEEYSY